MAITLTGTETKKCSRCRCNKPMLDYYRSKTSNDGFQYSCKSCMNEDRASRRRGDRVNTRTTLGILSHCAGCDLWKERAKYFYRSGSIGRGAGYCKECARGKSRTKFESKRNEILRRERSYLVELRLEMISAYGDACVCCGEARWEFLTLDHVGGGGNRHRKLLGGTRAVMKHLKKLGWPKDGFRLLCYNCNCSIGARGYCPHEMERHGVPLA